MNPLGEVNDVGNGCGLLLDGGFFIVIGNEVHIVADGGGGAPEKEPVDPPSEGISVFL